MTNTVSDTVSDETLNSIITIESSGKPTAKASTSSALGLFQFLNATWLATVKMHRPDLLKGRTQAEVLALRTDPSMSIEIGARFTEDNLALIGRNATGGDLYLAHFLGAGDARKLFRSAPSTPVSELVSSAVIAANRSIMEGKTCAQVRAWSARRMAQSAGHDWIARYYKGAPVDQPEQTVPEDDPEPKPEDFPDPQQPDPAPEPKKPAADAKPDPKPTPITPRDNENFPDWLKRKGKTIATWGGFGTFGIGGLGATTDWRIVAVLVGGAVLISGVVGLFYLASRRSST